MRVAMVSVLATCVLGPGCFGKEKRKPYDSTGALYCGSDAECVELCHGDPGCLQGYCAETVDAVLGALSFCTKPCALDTDCTSDLVPVGLRCGVLADGSRGCVEACSGGLGAPGSFACVDGVPTDCALAPDAFCEVCGCPADLRCVAGVGCQPKLGLGDACGYDSACLSNHCSATAGVCRVGVGEPCNDQNCDLCLMATDGWSWCSRNCSSGSCNNRGVCLQSSVATTCQPGCSTPSDPRCHGRCEEYVDPSDTVSNYFCYCAPGVGSCI